MPITFYQPNSQGTDCLQMTPPKPCLWTSQPPVHAIRTLKICDERGCGLVQAIQAVDCGGVDLMSLMETTHTETYSVARPSCAGGAQGNMGRVSRHCPNGWGGRAMRFHKTNVASYNILKNFPEGGSIRGLATE